jgi:hypothetical protein
MAGVAPMDGLQVKVEAVRAAAAVAAAAQASPAEQGAQGETAGRDRMACSCFFTKGFDDDKQDSAANRQAA